MFEIRKCSKVIYRVVDTGIVAQNNGRFELESGLTKGQAMKRSRFQTDT